MKASKNLFLFILSQQQKQGSKSRKRKKWNRGNRGSRREERQRGFPEWRQREIPK